MKDEIVKLDTANLAREKGLDFELDLGGNCTCYNKDKELVCYHVHFQYPDRDEYVFAPTQSFLQKWLRDEHRLHIEVKPWKSKEDVPVWHAQVFTLTRFNVSFQSFEYVKALEKGLVLALNLLKDKE